MFPVTKEWHKVRMLELALFAIFTLSSIGFSACSDDYNYYMNFTNTGGNPNDAFFVNSSVGFNGTPIIANPSLASAIYFNDSSHYAICNSSGDVVSFESEPRGGLNYSPTSVYPSGILAVWHLGNNGANDSTAYARTASFNSAPGIFAGIFGNASNITSSKSLTVSDMPAMSSATGGTFLTWIKTSNPSQAAIVFWASGGAEEFYIKSNKLYHWCDSGSEQSNTSQPNLNDGIFHSVGFTIDTSGDVQLLQDGIISASFYQGCVTTEGTGYLGSSDGGGGQTLGGLMDEARVYDHVLTAEEYSQIYNNSINKFMGLGNITATAIDTTPPITSVTFTNLNSTAINTTLSCHDSGTGCDDTEYCIDTLNACVPSIVYPPAFIFNPLNYSYLRYHSNDNEGNIEPVKSNIVGNVTSYYMNITEIANAVWNNTNRTLTDNFTVNSSEISADVWNYANRSLTTTEYLSIHEQEQLYNASNPTFVINGSINASINESSLMAQINATLNNTVSSAAQNTTDNTFVMIFTILSIVLAAIALRFDRTMLWIISGAMFEGLGFLFFPINIIIGICCVGVGLYLWIRIFRS